MATIEDVGKFVITGKKGKVKGLCDHLLKKGMDPLEIINKGLIGGMVEVGVRFKANTMFIPEVMMSAEAMAAGTEIVKPFIKSEDMPSAGTVFTRHGQR